MFWDIGDWGDRNPSRRSGRILRVRLLKSPAVIDSRAIDNERRWFATTLEAVGPDAATNAGAWSARCRYPSRVLDRFAGVPTYIGRAIVTSGVRLNDIVRRHPQLANREMETEKRRGFDATIAALREPSPRLLLRPTVRVVGLFEVWAHHEDVRRPNGIDRERPPELDDVIACCVDTHELRILPTYRLTTWPTGLLDAMEALDRSRRSVLSRCYCRPIRRSVAWMAAALAH